MTTSTTYISRSAREQDGQNLPLLQEQALTAIQTYAPDTWTDHNPTDPGITLLEVLAFVISDLSYRLGFPIRDLMAWPDDQRESAASPFWLAPDMLPANAVTLDDYQRLILDVPGVRFVSLEQDDQGRYVVTIDTDDSEDISDDDARLALAKTIRERFMAERNVNEDLAQVRFIEKHSITLRLALAFTQLDDPTDTLIEVFRNLQEAISPTLEKHSLEALMDEGDTPDQVMLGPYPQNGYIREGDLGAVSFPDTIFASDLIASLQDIDSITDIQTLTFVDSTQTDDSDEQIHWRYELDEEDMPQSFSLDLESSLDNLTLEIDGQTYPLSEDQIDDILTSLQTTEESDADVTSSVLEDLHAYQQGKYRELGVYYSLQHEFPTLYNLVDERLDGDIDSEELAVIMQLKGFLTLFDQILADQFAQLEVLKSLLALPSQDDFVTLAKVFDKMLASESLLTADLKVFWQAVKRLPKTYLSQPITDISGMENLLGDYWSSYAQDGFQPIAEAPFTTRQLARLNRAMSHLLARYCESTLDANLLQYKEVLNFYLAPLKNTLADEDRDDKTLLKNMVQLKQVVDKATLLMDYPRLSRYRAGGFDYLQANPKENFVTSLGHRILRFLGVKKTNAMPLSINNKEGMYLIEGTLLWAGESIDSDTDDAAASDDTIQRTLYYVLPDWPTRFRNSHFQTLMEGTIAKETPVHFSAKVLYLERRTMNYFEQLYYAWLNAMMKCPFPVIRRDATEGDVQISPTEDYAQAWLDALSTKLKRFLVYPTETDIVPESYLSPIGEATINPTDTEQDITNFRVHYQPLDFLKAKSTIGTAVINADDSQSTFNINIQTPNIIKE